MDATWRGKLTIRPGAKTAQVRSQDIRKLAEAVPDDVSTSLEVRVGKAYQSQLPFIRTAPFDAVLRHYPSMAKLVVAMTDPKAQVSVGGVMKTGAKELAFDISRLPVGEHEVVAKLGDTAKCLSFCKEPEPEWLTAKAGNTDEVPPPWTPLEVDGEKLTVKCWGREYDFSGLFPQQIRCQGDPLLAAPMRLRAGELTAGGSARLVEKTPTVVKLVNHGTLGQAEIDVATQIEFDGFVWFDVKLRPGQSGEAKLDSLTLEIPLKPARATLFYSGSYTCKDTGTLPTDGYRGAWRHRFWVGDEEGGIQWFAESQRGWSITRRDRTLAIKDGLVRLAIADAPLTITKPLELSFGIMATPVRPRPADWRSWRFGSDEINREDWRHVVLWATHWGTRWNYPIPKPHVADWLRREYAAGTLPCLYCNVTRIAPNTPEYRYWHEEWRVAPSSRVDFAGLRADDENVSAAACPRSTYTDFYVWALDRAINEADIRALYFDVSDAPFCKNEAHGCGWRDEEGHLHETLALRATREFQKRVYVVGKRHRPDFLVAIHMSGNICMPQHSFSNIMIDGENFTSIMQSQWAEKKRGDYFDFITLDRMRAQFMLHNFGPVPAFLPEFARALGDQCWTDDPEVMRAAKHLVGLFTVHDAPMWQAWMPTMPLRRVWYVQRRFGWDDKVEFVPYWSNPAVLDLEPKDPAIVASVFKRPGRIMIVVMNNT
ncbi:MAG: glycoside hydrolase domain-containing protein, partial [Pirellulales bacterium]